jgi:hypothetical protein
MCLHGHLRTGPSGNPIPVSDSKALWGKGFDALAKKNKIGTPYAYCRVESDEHIMVVTQTV